MVSPLDLLFPKICVGCNGEGSWLCQACYDPILSAQAPSCADCGRLTPDGRYCQSHKEKHHLTGLISVGNFSPGVLREAIHSLKYNGVQELAVPLGVLLASRLRAYPHLRLALPIPIPLHPTRQSERGFNQAELITAVAYPKFVPLGLVRYRSTTAQASLTHEARLTNVVKAFGLRRQSSAKLAKQTVVLVDDVATTGATLDAAAAILKQAGTRSIWGAVLAKG